MTTTAEQNIPATAAGLDFDKLGGLVPAVIQDASSSQVLMVGFMNDEALRATVSTGVVTFFSRTKGRLWTKGETSGNTLEVVEIATDCDVDSVLIRVKANGPGVCHEGYASCFFRSHVNGEWSTNAERTYSPESVYGGAQ
jgi:phosphoribosyl-AMP cyclohydrolase